MTEFVTHDVKRFILEKPKDYKFIPGQATLLNKRPFTFTNLNQDLVLEFTIKRYPGGVTEKLHRLRPGDTVNIEEPWGTINYQGPGVFIAGGAGITPFIAIFRSHDMANSSLIFSNKSAKDIILQKELENIFDNRAKFVLTNKEKRIDKEFLINNISDFSQNFYLCGPAGMVKDLRKYLKELGAKSQALVFEK